MNRMCVSEEPSLNSASDHFSEQEYRHIALAAVTQCAELVLELATGGRADQSQVSACIEPLLVFDAEHTGEIYPRAGDFHNGLTVLERCFDSEGLRRHQEVVRYLMGMLMLQRRLSRLTEMQQTIRQRLMQIRHSRQLDHGAALSTTEFTKLSQLYQETLSTLSFRVHVSGSPEQLREQSVADRIRALLLAGIRSAMLWHQLGGRRWQLVFFKTRTRREVAALRRRLMAARSVDAAAPESE